MNEIIKVETEIKRLSDLFQKWNKGELNNVDMAHFIRKSNKKLEKVKQVCYCDESVCCLAHENHVRPHQNCILR